MKQDQRELFAREHEMLDTADRILKDGACRDESLVEGYRGILDSYRELLNQTKKIFRISDMTSTEIKRTEAKLKALLDNSDQGFMTVDRRLRVERAYSCECDRIFGKTIAGLRLDALLEERSGGTRGNLTPRLEALFATDSPIERQRLSAELPTLLTINGRTITIEYKFITSALEADETKLMLILTDISDRLRAEEQIRYLSHYDTLTGLYNRAFADGLLPHLQSEDSLPLGVIVCDVDGLKVVNDLFGHKTGDDLIRAAAGILRLSSRKEDIIARWGGDEFLILLPNTSSEQCQSICRRIEEGCRSQEAFPLTVRVSAGYATTDDLETPFEDTFMRADAMMYAQKHLRGRTSKKEIITGIARLIRQRDGELARRLDEFSGRAAGLLRHLEDDSVNQQDLIVLWIISHLKPITGTARVGSETRSRVLFSIGELSLSHAYSCLNARWDGQGTERNLSGADIPLTSRVYSLLSGFSASLADGLTPDQSLTLIQRESGRRYDPRLVELLERSLAARPPGTDPAL